MHVDLHSHSTISDGTAPIEEMVAAAEAHGYDAYAVTDHARPDTYRDVATAVRTEIGRLRRHTPMVLFAGVELNVEPEDIGRVARDVRRRGAEIVVVHGECVVADVTPGTNAAAVRTTEVDILAHPGLLTDQDAEEAVRHGVHVELSGRRGHSYANGHVYRTARIAKALLVVGSDAHNPTELLSTREVEGILRGAGASHEELMRIRDITLPSLVARLSDRAANNADTAPSMTRFTPGASGGT